MSKRVDPAVKWLSSLVTPLSPTEFLLGQAARLLADSGQIAPPFDPKKAIPPSVKRIETVQLSRDGMLVPIEGGFIVRLNSQRPQVRQNFACAHEIGHTFFYDLSGTRPWRPYESMSSYWAEEDLCYQFAEEMLMPSLVIQGIASGIPPTISNFQQLLKTFQVSVEALARRIVRLNLWHCILLVLVGNEGKSSELRRKVIYRDEFPQYYSINWNMLLSQDCDPYQALAHPGILRRSIVTSRDLFRQGKKSGYWSIESFCLGGSISKVVVSIIVPE